MAVYSASYYPPFQQAGVSMALTTEEFGASFIRGDEPGYWKPLKVVLAGSTILAQVTVTVETPDTSQFTTETRVGNALVVRGPTGTSTHIGRSIPAQVFLAAAARSPSANRIQHDVDKAHFAGITNKPALYRYQDGQIIEAFYVVNLVARYYTPAELVAVEQQRGITTSLWSPSQLVQYALLDPNKPSGNSTPTPGGGTTTPTNPTTDPLVPTNPTNPFTPGVTQPPADPTFNYEPPTPVFDMRTAPDLPDLPSLASQPGDPLDWTHPTVQAVTVDQVSPLSMVLTPGSISETPTAQMPQMPDVVFPAGWGEVAMPDLPTALPMPAMPALPQVPQRPLFDFEAE